jgi:hypothetical protein
MSIKLASGASFWPRVTFASLYWQYFQSDRNIVSRETYLVGITCRFVADECVTKIGAHRVLFGCASLARVCGINFFEAISNPSTKVSAWWGILCRFTRPKHTKRFGRPRPCVHDVFTGRSSNLVPTSSERCRHKNAAPIRRFYHERPRIHDETRKKVPNSFFDILDSEISDSSCC